MRAVRLLAAAVPTLLACRPPAGITLAAAPGLDVVRSEATLFLIGDAGGTDPRGDRVLRELARQGRAAPRGSAIVFLGDNVYPAGVPDSQDHAVRVEAERRLLAQARVAQETGLAVYFVPGNHDWARHRDDGWAAVQRAEAVLARFAADSGAVVKQIPSGGCPGPAAVESNGFRILAIDTQWWLHNGPRPGDERGARAGLPDPSVRCSTETPEEVTSALAGLLAERADRVDVVVGHHPLESHGEHGGYHPTIQWLLPVVPTPIAPWLWLPIGWIYPAGRRWVADAQDQASERNRTMRTAIEGSFAVERGVIYASGHEHDLEVIRHGAGRFYLVSGAGMENHGTAVAQGDSTAFRSSRPGFMRLDRTVDGRLRLGVTIIDASNQPIEAHRSWLDRID